MYVIIHAFCMCIYDCVMILHKIIMPTLLESLSFVSFEGHVQVSYIINSCGQLLGAEGLQSAATKELHEDPNLKTSRN